MIKIDFKNKRILLILLIISWVILCLIIILVGLYNNSKNKYGDALEITNLNSYIKDKPQDKDTLDFIKHNLLETVQYNTNYKIENNSINNINIRDKSFNQLYNKQLDLNNVNFIVDIADIKQSYSVSYQWSNNSSSVIENENGTIVSCLPVNQLIYGDFNCKDKNSIESGDNNPILQYLPYSTPNYIITAEKIDNKIILNIAILLNESDILNGNSGIAVATYKQESIDWIKSKQLNPEDYSINYIISH